MAKSITKYRNLEAELAREGLTRENLAELLDVSVATMSKKLSYINRLKLYEAKRIRDLLFPELSIDYLFETE